MITESQDSNPVAKKGGAFAANAINIPTYQVSDDQRIAKFKSRRKKKNKALIKRTDSSFDSTGFSLRNDDIDR